MKINKKDWDNILDANLEFPDKNFHVFNPIHSVSDEDEIKILSLSGAATAGAGIGSFGVEMVNLGYKFTHYVGVSYGSVIALPLVLGKHDIIIEESTTKLEHENFFKVSPMTKKGNISFKAIMRLFGSFIFPNKIKSFGVQDVQPLLRKYVSEQEFEYYQNSDLPVIYIVAVSAVTQEPVVFNIKDKSITYQRYLDIVSASSRIPVWTQPMVIDGVEYYDGGVTDINASCVVLDMFKDKNVVEVVSAYPFSEAQPYKWKPIKGILGSIFWLIDAFVKNVGHSDTIIEQMKCHKRGIKLTQAHIPKILDNIYSVDKEDLAELARIGKMLARKNWAGLEE